MAFPLQARVKVTKGRFKDSEGIITHISNGWYQGRTYTVVFDNNIVRAIRKNKLQFIKWDAKK